MADDSVLVAEDATATLPGRKVVVGDRDRNFPLHGANDCESDVPLAARNQLRPTVGCGREVEDYRVLPTAKVQRVRWLAASHQRLKELLELEEDWDSYGAPPPNRLAVSRAMRVLRVLNKEGLPAPCINPSAEEGVCMSFRAGCLYADMECFNSGEILAATSDGKGERRVWEVHSRESEIIKAARVIRTFLRSRGS